MIIMQNLRALDFPQCVHAALGKVVDFYTTNSAAKPDEVIERTVNELIYGLRYRGSGKFVRRHSAIQELQVVQILFQFFDADLKMPGEALLVKRAVFSSLVSQTVEPEACESLISKLISLAITMKGSCLLDTAALWMISQREEGEIGLGLAERLVEQIVNEFCDLSLVDVGKSLREIPDSSEQFASSFLCVATSMYSLPGLGSDKPEISCELLTVINDWLADRPGLILIGQNLNQSGTAVSLKGRVDESGCGRVNPLPGLVRWICCSVFIPEHLSTNGSWSNIFPCLKLSVLRCMQSYNAQSSLVNHPPITLSDVGQVINDLSLLNQKFSGLLSREGEGALETATESLLQILTVALAKGAFICNPADWNKICQALPQCRLKEVIMNNEVVRQCVARC